MPRARSRAKNFTLVIYSNQTAFPELMRPSVNSGGTSHSTTPAERLLGECQLSQSNVYSLARREHAHRQMDAGVVQSIHEDRDDPGWAQRSLDNPTFKAGLVEQKDIGDHDDALFHACHLADMSDFPAAIHQALDMND